jgi:hypothetical protein
MSSLKRKLLRLPSPLHGHGLFTTVEIPRHTIIGKCIVKKTVQPGPHTLWIDDGAKKYDVMCRLKFINHSKRPNVAYLDDLNVMALRTIRPGEELTHDYGDEWE